MGLYFNDEDDDGEVCVLCKCDPCCCPEDDEDLDDDWNAAHVAPR